MYLLALCNVFIKFMTLFNASAGKRWQHFCHSFAPQAVNIELFLVGANTRTAITELVIYIFKRLCT